MPRHVDRCGDYVHAPIQERNRLGHSSSKVAVLSMPDPVAIRFEAVAGGTMSGSVLVLLLIAMSIGLARNATAQAPMARAISAPDRWSGHSQILLSLEGVQNFAGVSRNLIWHLRLDKLNQRGGLPLRLPGEPSRRRPQDRSHPHPYRKPLNPSPRPREPTRVRHPQRPPLPTAWPRPTRCEDSR
jgi:hypothetical protein